MGYSIKQLADIKAKAISKIVHELEIAQNNKTIDEFLEKYGIVFEEYPLPVDIRTMRILVLGELAGSKKDYQMRAKKLGINIDHIEFVDYEKSKRLDAYNLKDSGEYSDIIYGPNPHITAGIDGATSLLSLLEKTPSRYPRLSKAIANGKLKISIKSFEHCLTKTRFFETLISR